MAKQRRNNSIKAALSAVTTAIRAEADGNLTPEAKAAVVNNAMDVVDDSNFVTLAEHTDDAIELKHQIEEAEAAELIETELNENDFKPELAEGDSSIDEPPF